MLVSKIASGTLVETCWKIAKGDRDVLRIRMGLAKSGMGYGSVGNRQWIKSSARGKST